MPFYKVIFFLFVFIFNTVAGANAEEGLLPPEQAFTVSARALSTDKLEVTWQIAEGYLVYRNNLRFESKTPEAQIGTATFPSPSVKHDELLGDIQHYHDPFTVNLPLKLTGQVSTLQLVVYYQGCADNGVCYRPQKQILDIVLPNDAKPIAKASSLTNFIKGFSSLNLTGGANNELLPPEQAFQFFASVKDANTLHVNWEIAQDYYLYREKIQLTLVAADGVQLGHYVIPNGTPKHDEAFGKVEIFHNDLAFDVPLLRSKTDAQTLSIKADFQGCADRGVC